MTIYSFDDVLRASKSIHSVELTPGGSTKIALWRPVPWIAFVYFVVVEFVFVLAARVPVLNVLSEVFAPLVYYVALPIGVVWLAFKVELDGLSPHVWAIGYLLFLRRPKRVLAGCELPGEGVKISYSGRVKIWWDINAPRLHHGCVTGGKITTTVPIKVSYAIFPLGARHAVRRRNPVLVPDEDREPCVDSDVQGKLRVRP